MSASSNGLSRRWMLLAILALASCAQFAAPRIGPGASSDQVMQAAGPPSQERTLPDGTKAWYYVNGPSGWTTYRVHFDSSGRVQDNVQVLTGQNFREHLIASKTTRAQAEDAFGRAGLVTMHPNLQEEVWTYRWLDGTISAKTDIHFDPGTGIVKYYSIYWDPCPSGPLWCAGT